MLLINKNKFLKLFFATHLPGAFFCYYSVCFSILPLYLHNQQVCHFLTNHMKKTFLLGVLIPQLLFTACGDGKPQQESTEKIETAEKLVNNDLNNQGLKGRVKSFTSSITMSRMNTDGVVLEETKNTLTSLFDEDGFEIKQVSYNADGTVSRTTIITKLQDGKSQHDIYDGKEELVSKKIISRNDTEITEQSIEGTKQHMKSQAVSKLNKDFLIESVERVNYNMLGNPGGKRKFVNTYDSDRNMIGTKMIMTKSNGSENVSDMHIIVQEKDKHSNPTKTISSAAQGNEKIKIVSERQYEYYE